jgi:hypothetical protein
MSVSLWPWVCRCTLAVVCAGSGLASALPIELGVHGQRHTELAPWVASGGIPLAHAQRVFEPAELELVDGDGVEVPMQARVLARWMAGGSDPAAPIQWLHVHAELRGDERLWLRRRTSPAESPQPTHPLRVVQQGSAYLVTTGAAAFLVDPTQGALFSEVRTAQGEVLARGRPSAVQLEAPAGVQVPYSLRFARIESAGSLAVSLLTEHLLSPLQQGGGALVLRRHYRFEAGSATARVSLVLAWEGGLCGRADELVCSAGVNGLRVRSAHEGLVFEPAAARRVLTRARRGDTPHASRADQITRLVQLRREQRLQPRRFALSVDGSDVQGGTAADAAAMAIVFSQASLAAGIERIDLNEPQGLQLDPAARELRLDWVAAPGVWLGNRQGLHAQVAIAVLPGDAVPAATQHAALTERVSDALSEPFLLWPSAAQFAASGAVPEFPHGALPPAFSGFDKAVDAVLEHTRERVEAEGLHGLMTHGLWPSYWGTPSDPPIACAGADPTPAEAWDDTYWCASWTDYHNVAIVPALAAFRAGDPHRWRAFSLPAARRMLHTQIQQCAPEDPWFYCGQAPSGGGGYRAHFNSSHAYFENLLLYYFLSADPWVPERLLQGARSMRGYLCPARFGPSPGPMCAPAEPGTDPWVQLSDRAASQWYDVFRALGQSVDSSFLEDWRGGLARWLSLHYAQGVDARGQTLGVLAPSGVGAGLSILAPGRYGSAQLWMASGYDFEQLARFSAAAPGLGLGQPVLMPEQVIEAWGRTLALASRLAPGGDGSASGVWPNALAFEWSGARIGGQLRGLEPDWHPASIPQPCLDACLYVTGKSFLSAAVARAARLSGDPALLALAQSLIVQSLDALAARPQVLGKETGLLLTRLPAAIAALQPPLDAQALFGSGFESAPRSVASSVSDRSDSPSG